MGLLPLKWEAKKRLNLNILNLAQGYDDGRRKVSVKGSNGSTVTQRKSEVAGELGAMSCELRMG